MERATESQAYVSRVSHDREDKKLTITTRIQPYSTHVSFPTHKTPRVTQKPLTR